jgi:hypothetical protein
MFDSCGHVSEPGGVVSGAGLTEISTTHALGGGSVDIALDCDDFRTFQPPAHQVSNPRISPAATLRRSSSAARRGCGSRSEMWCIQRGGGSG